MISKKSSIAAFLLTLVVILWGLFPAQVYASQERNDPAFSKIDKFVTSKMNELRIPGISIGIVQGDQITYIQGYGYADSKKRPVTPRTPFMLGSVSKSFTALAVMQLAEKGQIDLDAPVQNYIPWFRVKDSIASSKITVRNLLIQNSGIPGSAVSNHLNDKLSTEEFVKQLSTLELTKPVGQEFQYTDANYSILGLIIEKVSGDTYQEYIKKNVFQSLDMKHSYVSKSEAEKDGLSTGYRTLFGFPVAADLTYPVQFIPSGLIISSAEDMTHYLKIFINSGMYNNTAIVSNSGIQQLQHPSVPLTHPEGYSYGMGWYISKDYMTHTGELSNYYSCMVITPKNKTGVIILANANNKLVTGEYTMSIAFGISDMLSAKNVTDSSSGFRQLYTTFDIFVLAVLIILLIRFILSLTVYRRKLPNKNENFLGFTMKHIILDLLILTLVIGTLLYLLKSFGTTFSDGMLGQPDIMISFTAFTALTIINMIIRLSISITRFRRIRNQFDKRISNIRV